MNSNNNLNDHLADREMLDEEKYENRVDKDLTRQESISDIERQVDIMSAENDDTVRMADEYMDTKKYSTKNERAEGVNSDDDDDEDIVLSRSHEISSQDEWRSPRMTLFPTRPFGGGAG